MIKEARSTPRPSTADPQPQAALKLPALLKTYEKQIAMALPKHLTAERMIRVALTAFNRNPELANCDVLTIAGAIVQASQLGLEPDGVLGHAYLVPFRNWKNGNRMECQLIPGYKGLLDLARRSGRVAACNAHLVHAADEFDWSQGLEEKLVHKPLLMRRANGVWVMVTEEERGEPVLTYATAQLRDGGHALEVMAMYQVHQIRDKSSQAGAEIDYKGNAREAKGPWVDYYEWMVRKTVLKQLLKLLPLSVEMQTAVALTDRHEAGMSQELEDVIHHASERGPMPESPQTINVQASGEDRDAAARREAGLDGSVSPTPQAPVATAAPAAPQPPAQPAQGRLAGLSIDDFTAEEFTYLQSTMKRVKNFNRAQLSEWLGQYSGTKFEALGEANVLLGDLESKAGK